MREILCGTYKFLIYWSIVFICALKWTLLWSELCFTVSTTLDPRNEKMIKIYVIKNQKFKEKHEEPVSCLLTCFILWEKMKL